MIQKILASGSPKLRLVSKPVFKIDKKVKEIIDDLEDTLSTQKEPEGVGLAAPQIGKNLRIFVMSHQGVERVIVNPEILDSSYTKTDREAGYSNRQLAAKRVTLTDGKLMEGCLSLPHYYGAIRRPNFVKLKYKNPKLESKTEEFKDFFAQIVLHEIDHLDGVLFIDRLLEQKKPLYKLVGKEWEEVELV